MRDIALEIPLRGFGVGGFGQGDDADVARGEMFGDALDGAILAGGVAPFQDDQQFLAAFDDVALQLHQLDLQMAEGFFIALCLGHNRA